MRFSSSGVAARLPLALVTTAALGALLALSPSVARAQDPVVTFTNTTGQNLINPPFTLGFAFTANGTLTVSDLGLFDSDLDGLAESHEIGLFDSVGTLLTSGTVASGTAAPLTNQFRYTSVNMVTLTGGQTYFVGAVYNSGADALLFPGDATDLAINPLITYQGATYALGNTLTVPTLPGGGDGYFGPNFKVSAAANPVPEPSEYAVGAMFAGTLLIGMVRGRRRKGTKGSAKAA